jgi:hypothetical protein
VGSYGRTEKQGVYINSTGKLQKRFSACKADLPGRTARCIRLEIFTSVPAGSGGGLSLTNNNQTNILFFYLTLFCIKKGLSSGTSVTKVPAEGVAMQWHHYGSEASVTTKGYRPAT